MWDTPIKQDSGTFLGVFSKFSDQHPVTFVGEYSPGIELQDYLQYEAKTEHH